MIEVDSNWTADEAWEAQQREWERDRRPDSEKRPEVMEQWWLAFSLRESEQRLKNGDDGAVMDGIAVCVMHGVPLPEWLATAFMDRRGRVKDFEAGSWDDVFGRPHKRGVHVSKAAVKRTKEFLIFFRAREILQNEPSTSISAGLFERVGREFGFSKTVADEIYYDWWSTFNKGWRSGHGERIHIEYEGRTVSFVVGDPDRIGGHQYVKYDGKHFSARRSLPCDTKSLKR